LGFLVKGLGLSVIYLMESLKLSVQDYEFRTKSLWLEVKSIGSKV
jgi:hypothetical protein